MKRKMMLMGTLLGMATVSMFTACGNSEKKICLEDYYTYSIVGLNGYGSVEDNFDEERFMEDLLKAAKKKEDSEEGMELLFVAESSFESAWTKAEGLSNGDAISHTWNCDEVALSEYHITLSATDEDAKVDGLEEPETYDAFDGINFTTDGIAPNGSLYLDTSACYGNLLYYSNAGSGLSNGDKVTITAKLPTDDVNQYYAQYGKLPETLTMEYEVSGLDEIVTKVDQIPNDTLDQMVLAGRNALEEYFGFLEGVTLNDYELQGVYVVTPDNGAFTTERVYLISKVTVSDNVVTNSSYYTYACFNGLLAKSDGTVDVDVNYFTQPSANAAFGEIIGEGFFFDGDDQCYAGYQTMEELINQAIWPYTENSLVDTNIVE